MRNTISISVTPEQLEKIELYALEMGTSRSGFLQTLIRTYEDYRTDPDIKAKEKKKPAKPSILNDLFGG